MQLVFDLNNLFLQIQKTHDIGLEMQHLLMKLAALFKNGFRNERLHNDTGLPQHIRPVGRVDELQLLTHRFDIDEYPLLVDKLGKIPVLRQFGNVFYMMERTVHIQKRAREGKHEDQKGQKYDPVQAYSAIFSGHGTLNRC